MKGITGNPALDAYQRMAVKPLSSPQQSPSAPASQNRAAAAGAAKVSISSEAHSIAASQASTDTQKVDSIRAAIQEGSFRVDSAKVAQLMVDGGGA